MTIACVHMSGLFVRSFRPLAKVGFATPVPDMPAVSVGQWVLRSFARHGSIDHAIFLPCKSLCSGIPRLRPIRAWLRRGEPRSRLAAGHRHRRREAALTAARPARCCPMVATIRLARHHHLPGDARRLVGQCHRRQLRRLARNHPGQPRRGLRAAAAYLLDVAVDPPPAPAATSRRRPS